MLRGSLAVWCDTASKKISGLEPRMDLHFNLWLDLLESTPDGSNGVLDIGILLKESRQIDQLNIYLPASIPLNAVQDLSAVLQDEATLSAVFNSTLSLCDDRKHSFEVKNNASGKIDFCVVKLNLETDIAIQKLESDEGTIIKFRKEMFANINKTGGDHYIRFRLKLIDDLTRLFQDASNPADKLFLSGFHTTDVVEFRVNERRNFTPALRCIPKNYPKIETIQYFLVRNIKTELVRAHADFRKMRRLEPNLWNKYLEELGTSSPENWIIYQWRSGGIAGGDVEDFIALAFFEGPRYNLRLYIIAIVLLGAGGSAVQAVTLIYIKGLYEWPNEQYPLWIQFVILLSFIGLLYLLTPLPQRVRFLPRKIFRKLRSFLGR